MMIQNIKFDIPVEEDLRKWDYGFIKEKGKHPLRFLWLDTYVQESKVKGVSRECHLLECTSRGVLTLDGMKLKNEKEVKEASKLFEMSIFRK